MNYTQGSAIVDHDTLRGGSVAPEVSGGVARSQLNASAFTKLQGTIGCNGRSGRIRELCNFHNCRSTALASIGIGMNYTQGSAIVDHDTLRGGSVAPEVSGGVARSQLNASAFTKLQGAIGCNGRSGWIRELGYFHHSRSAAWATIGIGMNYTQGSAIVDHDTLRGGSVAPEVSSSVARSQLNTSAFTKL